jgi:hypothetical protein
MSAKILEVADKLEKDIREFLKDKKEARFPLPELGINEFAIALMIAVFEEEGWEAMYDSEDGEAWINFFKEEPLLLGVNGGA